METKFYFYAVIILALVIFLIAFGCYLLPHLRQPAKQGLFVGFIFGLLSLGFLSTLLFLQIMYFPQLIFALFSVGFVLGSGLYFIARLVSFIIKIRGSHA